MVGGGEGVRRSPEELGMGVGGLRCPAQERQRFQWQAKRFES